MTTKLALTPGQNKILKRAEYLLAVAGYALGEVTDTITVHYDKANCDEVCIIEDIEMARDDLRDLLGMPELTDESREAEFHGFNAQATGV